MRPELIVAITVCFIVWIIFGTLRRYLTTRSNAAIQEKVFARIDSAQSMLELAANESGRRFLESLTLERVQPAEPGRRILHGIQMGAVLTCFGLALLFLHHALSYMPEGLGLLIFGAGAVGLGVGFFIAAALSLALSRSLPSLSPDLSNDARR